MTREFAPAALHNMSAPPRSIVDVRVLRPPGNARTPWSSDLDDAEEHDRAGAGGRLPSGEFFARVCLVGLLHDGRAHELCNRDIARMVDHEPHELVDAVAMLRTGGEPGSRMEAERRAVRALPLNALHDEFLERVAALGPMDLPPLLLARSIPQGGAVPVQRPIEPLVALRLLAGTAGGLFLRARAPSVGLFLFGTPGASLGPNDTTFDYYLLAGAARR